MTFKLDLKVCLGLAAVYVTLHACAIWATLPRALSWSYPFLIVAPAISAAVSALCARRARATIRTAWWLVAVALAIWSMGMAFSWVQYATDGRVQTLAEASDILCICYDVPLLMALVLPLDSRQRRLFTVLEYAQAAWAVGLLYVLVFRVLPFSGDHSNPETLATLVRFENIENTAIAALATGRWLLERRAGRSETLFPLLTAFLWLYAAVAAGNNALVQVLGDNTGFVDLAGPIPFLLFAAGAWARPAEKEGSVTGFTRAGLGLDNASHILLTLLLVILGAFALRSHFALGLVSVLLSLAVYAARSILLQDQLLKTQLELQEMGGRLETLSQQDGLTGLANRRMFDRALEMEWQRMRLSGQPLSLLMVDVDHFKQLNDTQGHLAGDECLVRIAGLLRSVSTNGTQTLARYGGEEFALVLPSTDSGAASCLGQTLLGEIRGLNMPNRTMTADVVTASIGIATCDDAQGATARELLELADKKLYEAKCAGRNQLAMAELRMSRGDLY